MSYLGCLKTLIYSPIFRLFGNGAYAVREPALLFGAASVWLFFLLLRRIAGNRAGLVGCWLLAADSLYLLTTCYDWGPVALQHLLIVGGVLLLMRFYQTKSNASLALGFLLFGLALWDKALALWMLSGFGIAGDFDISEANICCDQLSPAPHFRRGISPRSAAAHLL